MPPFPPLPEGVRPALQRPGKVPPEILGRNLEDTFIYLLLYKGYLIRGSIPPSETQSGV